MKQNKKISILLNKMLPAFVSHEHTKFVDFLKAYFEYLESDLQPYDIAFNSSQYSDIDATTDLFLDNFKKTYIEDIPDSMVADAKHVIKNIRDFYLTKGNILSYEVLFRIVYGADVEIYFPKVDILKCSDGKWYQPYYLSVSDVEGFLHKFIIDPLTNTTGFVDDVFTFEGSPALKVSNIVGTFVSGNTIYVKDDENTFQAVTTVTQSDGQFLNTDGFLSSNKYLQDNYYYQNYSYEITSTLPIEAYEEVVYKTIHPTGLKLFGVLETGITNIVIPTELVYNITDYSFITILTPTTIVIGEFQYNVNSIIFNNIQHSSPIDHDYTYVRSELLKGVDGNPYIVNEYTIVELENVQILEFTNNESDANTIVTINGSQTDEYSLINTQLTLDTPHNINDDMFVVSLGADITHWEFNGDGVETHFELDNIYNINDLLVFADGDKQLNTTEVYINNTDLVFVTPPTSHIKVYKYNKEYQPQYFDASNNEKTFELNEIPRRRNKTSLLVFVDGKMSQFERNSKTNIITPYTTPSSNVVVYYLDNPLVLYDNQLLDGVNTTYNVNNICSPFRKRPISEVTISVA